MIIPTSTPGVSVRFEIEKDNGTDPLVIRDTGRSGYRSVTNAAEEVVEYLVASGDLPAGRRLLYYDSSGDLDELKVADGKFAGFAPGPDRRAT